MPTAFSVPINNVVCLVGPGGYVAGSGTLTLATGQGAQFPALAGSQFYRLTVVQQAHAYDPLSTPANLTIFKATGRSGDVFTGLVPIEGTTDRNYVGGDVVDVRVTAGVVTDLQGAINALENADRYLCQGRLSVSATTNGDAGASSTTLYFNPHLGNQIALYDGSTGWNTITFSTTTLACPSTANCFDIFGYSSGGVLTLEAVPWTSTGNLTGADGSRSVALVNQDGIPVKSGAPARRFLGTIYSNATNIRDLKADRWVWNQYNQISKSLFVAENQSIWTYSGNWRASNGNANGLSTFHFVNGGSINIIDVSFSDHVNCPGGVVAYIGIGYDTTSAPNSPLWCQSSFSVANMLTSRMAIVPNLGWHSFFGMEQTSGGTVTFLGNPYIMLDGRFWC